MLTKEAQQKYNIKKVSRKYVISTADFQRMVDDYPTLLSAAHDTGLASNTLLQWKVLLGIGWPTNHAPAQYRLNYRPEIGSLKWQEKEEAQIKIQRDWENYTGKVISIGCTHFPFVDIDYLNYIIALEDGNLGRVILNGDTLDFSNVSKFRKEYNISPLTEVKEATIAIRELKKYAESILLVNANHDSRFQKRLMEKLTPDENELLEEMVGISPTEHLANISEVDGTGLWYIRLGNAIFCHPERGVTAKLGTVKRAADFWSVRQTGIDAIILSHTHQIGSAIYRKMLIAETGCLTRTPDYTMAGNIGMQTDLMYCGYFRGEYVNGNLDIHRSNYIYLGPTR